MKKKPVFVIFLLLLLFSLSLLFTKFPHQKESIFGQTNPDPGGIQISSSYYGKVISKSDYDYAPSIMFDDGIYKMWWCSLSSSGVGDNIWYATSEDGFNWSNKKIVLKPSGDREGIHTCDPSVVKVNNQYYLYYTSDSPDFEGRGNQIFLATSTDGIHWDKYPSNEDPQPVIPCESPVDHYCVGQSSVLYKDGRFWHYFTIADEGGVYVYLKSSGDGVNFVWENNGEPVFGGTYGKNSVDVKYSSTLGLYFMVYGEVNDDKIYWNASLDGFHWLSPDDNRIIETQEDVNHNPGLLGSATGMIEEELIAYYGAGSSSPATWDIEATMITLSLSPVRCQSLGRQTLADFELGVDPRWQISCYNGYSLSPPQVQHYQDRNFWDVYNDGDGADGQCDVWLDLGGEDWSSCQDLTVDWAGSDNSLGATVRVWLMNDGSWNSNPLGTLTTSGSGWERQRGVVLDLSGQPRDRVDRLMFRTKEAWIPEPTPENPEPYQRIVLFDLSLSQCSVYDFNQDCILDSQDLKVLLENWGDSLPAFQTDLNSDGTVNGIDLGMILIYLRREE